MASDGSVVASSSQVSKPDPATQSGHPSWTVMVFMGATTFEGNVPLDAAAESDLEEMRAIGSVDGRLNIFVERHDNTGMRRYHIGKPKQDWDGEIKKKPAAAIGDGQALTRFVKDSMREAAHRPDDYTMLVLWGHAYDFAFGRRRERDGAVDALDFAELRDRLGEIQVDMFKHWHEGQVPIETDKRPKLDIIGFDACELSTVEMACQLEPYAKYLLGSEIGIPIPGWPYDRILDRVARPTGMGTPIENRPMTPAEFGSYVVRRFCESYEAKDPVSLTLLDLSYSTGLEECAGWLAQMLASAIADSESRAHITDVFSRSQTEAGRPYVDVADLCLNLARESSDASIVVAARELGNFLISPKEKVAGLSETGEGRPLVAEHGRNAGGLARLNGISLYAPHVAPERDAHAAVSLYDKFDFAQRTVWRALVHTLAQI